jgi:hypothetical protein
MKRSARGRGAVVTLGLVVGASAACSVAGALPAYERQRTTALSRPLGSRVVVGAVSTAAAPREPGVVTGSSEVRTTALRQATATTAPEAISAAISWEL